MKSFICFFVNDMQRASDTLITPSWVTTTAVDMRLPWIMIQVTNLTPISLSISSDCSNPLILTS